MAVIKVISAFPGTIYGSLTCLNSKVSNQYHNRGKLLIVYCFFSYTVRVHHDNKNVQCNAYYTWVDVDILTGMYVRRKQWDCSYLSLLNVWRQFFRYIHWNNSYATWMRIWIGKMGNMSANIWNWFSRPILMSFEDKLTRKLLNSGRQGTKN